MVKNIWPDDITICHINMNYIKLNKFTLIIAGSIPSMNQL